MMFPCDYKPDSRGSWDEERPLGAASPAFGQSEFDFLDADKDPEWPLLVFLR